MFQSMYQLRDEKASKAIREELIPLVASLGPLNSSEYVVAGAIIVEILTNPELSRQWGSELMALVNSLKDMRAYLQAQLESREVRLGLPYYLTCPVRIISAIFPLF